MTIQSKRIVNADIDVIWEVTLNVLAWPTWSPVIQATEKQDNNLLRLDDVFEVKQPMQAKRIWKVTEISEKRLARWQTVDDGPGMRASHLLEELKPGQTLSKLEIEGTTPQARRMLKVLAPLISLSLFMENRALQQHCERRG